MITPKHQPGEDRRANRPPDSGSRGGRGRWEGLAEAPRQKEGALKTQVECMHFRAG